MTEHQLRERVVSTAKGFLGRKESDGSHREIIDLYNGIKPLPNGYKMKYTDPWCAAFVSAVAWKCGLTSIIVPSASCPDMISKYQKLGRWKEDDNYMPQIGDIVFYDWGDSGNGDNKGVSDHVGIVSNIFSASFNVVEGNKSDSVSTRTMQRNGRYIRGFGLPDYTSVANQDVDIIETPVKDDTIVAPAKQEPPAQQTTYKISVPLLVVGSKGEAVSAAQILLIGRGCSCGRYGADGDFGAATLAAVKKYQRKYGLAQDGMIGSKTWAKLLGV